MLLNQILFYPQNGFPTLAPPQCVPYPQMPFFWENDMSPTTNDTESLDGFKKMVFGDCCQTAASTPEMKPQNTLNTDFYKGFLNQMKHQLTDKDQMEFEKQYLKSQYAYAPEINDFEIIYDTSKRTNK